MPPHTRRMRVTCSSLCRLMFLCFFGSGLQSDVGLFHRTRLLPIQNWRHRAKPPRKQPRPGRNSRHVMRTSRVRRSLIRARPPGSSSPWLRTIVRSNAARAPTPDPAHRPQPIPTQCYSPHPPKVPYDKALLTHYYGTFLHHSQGLVNTSGHP